MGNYFHKVPSNSHTSGATVRDGGCAAALPDGDSASQGLEQEPCIAHAALQLLPAALSAPLAQGELCAEASGESNNITHSQGLHVCMMGAKTRSRLVLPLTQAMQILASRHRGGQSLLKDSIGKLTLLVRARHPTCPGLK